MSTTCRKRTGAGTATTLMLWPSRRDDRVVEEPDMVEIVDDAGEVVGTATRAEMRARNLRHRGVGVLVRTTGGESWCIGGPVGRTCGRATGISPSAACCSRARTGSTVPAASWQKKPGIEGGPRSSSAAGIYEDDDVRVVGRIFVATHDGPYTFVDGEVERTELVPVARGPGVGVDHTVLPRHPVDGAAAAPLSSYGRIDVSVDIAELEQLRVRAPTRASSSRIGVRSVSTEKPGNQLS